MPMAAQWSELPEYLLELILEKLDLVDHARFASICSSWRSIAINNNPPINKPLYLALSHEPDHLVHRFITSFIPSWSYATFIGAAADGWLVILVDRLKLFLLNKGKGFNSIIPLPPPSKDPKFFLQRPQLCKVVLSSPPSSGECTAVIKHFFFGVFYCRRLGLDKSFTKLSGIPNCIHDILFCKGRLYVLCSPNVNANTIVIFDHLLKKVSHLGTLFHPTPKHLLILGNNIPSIVAREYDGQYFVYMLEEGSELRLVPLNDVGDNLLLLVNRYCSLSITAEEHREFRRATHSFKYDFSTSVLDTSEDPYKVKADDPCPLFFLMFRYYGIMNEVRSDVWARCLSRRKQVTCVASPSPGAK